MEGDKGRHGLGGAALALFMVALMCYLTLAALHGEHGLFRMMTIEAQEHRLEDELAAVREEHRDFANKTARLSAENLDPDLLDERARRILGLARADEILAQ